MIIDGVKSLMGAKVESWNDHRIAMALTIAGIKTFGSIRIDGAEAVRKSYPGFFEDVRALGGRVDIYTDPLIPLRSEISAIDESIVELLEKRFEVIEEIAEIKQKKWNDHTRFKTRRGASEQIKGACKRL